jgi:hypothetical protein
LEARASTCLGHHQRGRRSLGPNARIHPLAAFLHAAIMASARGLVIVSWIILEVVRIWFPHYWDRVLRGTAFQKFKLGKDAYFDSCTEKK